MGTIASLTNTLKAWFKNRPKLDLDGSATWFLLLFIYLHGLSSEGFSFDFKWSGIMPVITIPQVSLIMATVCLAVSALLLIEPLLPSKLRGWTKDMRQSFFWKYIYRLSVLTAFIMGLFAGLNVLTEKLPNFSWLTTSVVYVGLAIFFLMLIKLFLIPWGEQKTSTSDG